LNICFTKIPSKETWNETLVVRIAFTSLSIPRVKSTKQRNRRVEETPIAIAEREYKETYFLFKKIKNFLGCVLLLAGEERGGGCWQRERERERESIECKKREAGFCFCLH
jgi:hypothetical protein